MFVARATPPGGSDMIRLRVKLGNTGSPDLIFSQCPMSRIGHVPPGAVSASLSGAQFLVVRSHPRREVGGDYVSASRIYIDRIPIGVLALCVRPSNVAIVEPTGGNVTSAAP
jgi:hypothetical protein